MIIVYVGNTTACPDRVLKQSKLRKEGNMKIICTKF